MGRSDIESWIASTTPSIDGLDDDNDASHIHWKEAREDWPTFLRYGQRILLSSSTKERTAFLNGHLYPLTKQSLTQKEALEVFKLLTYTYHRYHDSKSREAVENIIKQLSVLSLETTEQMSRWTRLETARICEQSVSAASSRLVVLSWTCLVFTTALTHYPEFTTHKAWLDIVDALSLIYNSLLDESSGVRPSIRSGATTKVRRALRSVSSAWIPLVSSLLKILKDRQGALYPMPLLGVVYDVSSRASGQPPEVNEDVTSKKELIHVYATYILMSKTQVPTHVLNAFDGIISSLFDATDLEQSILPTMEKASLRAPEISLPVIAHFFSSFRPSLPEACFRRVLTIVMNSAKSSNPATRESSAKVFSSVMAHNSSNEEIAKVSATDILNALKTGKTTGVDHRHVLYKLTSLIPPSAASKGIAESIPTMFAKETNDVAALALASSLVSHLTYYLLNSPTVSKDLITGITSNLGSAKANLRRGSYILIGAALWNCLEGKSTSQGFKSAFDSFIPSLETSLKTVSGNPLSTPGGPLEGYIAIAIILGSTPLESFLGKAALKHANLLSSQGGKLPFLVWDKVYQKAETPEDHTWLLRALRVTIESQVYSPMKTPNLSLHFGQAFIHLAVNSNELEMRRETIVTLKSLNELYPETINAMIREALPVSLSHHSRTVQITGNSEESLHTKASGRWFPLLGACANFSGEADEVVKENLVTRLLVLAHHPVICGPSRQSWIDLCQHAKVDPRHLVATHKENIVKQLIHSLEDPVMQIAARHAAMTAVFVASEEFLPLLCEEIFRSFNSKELRTLTGEEIEIWRTPEGTLFVDVLAAKDNGSAGRKGKNAELEKWDMEVRKSLATKKAGAASAKAQGLSKQEKELVDAQLRKESEIRQKVEQRRRQLFTGLLFVQSIVDANVQETAQYFAQLVKSLLDGPVAYASELLGKDLYDTYMSLGSACSERLGSFSRWTGVATLRALKDVLVPVELREEPFYQLVLRVLHRLRTLSEQAPLDSTSFSYASPLLSFVVSVGGVEGGEEEERLEQVTLAMSIIAFHSAEFSNPHYPRVQAMKDLLTIAKRYPSLGKDTSSALLAIAESIHFDASKDDIDVLLDALLSKETNVRNAALQSLQVIDLTELEWSPEIWISCHDSDQQNARIARHLWEDNGLDIPSSFFEKLKGYLEHEHASVRISCALSLGDAVALWPDQIQLVVTSLQDLYHNRAQILGPEYDEYGILISRSAEESDPWQLRVAIATAFEAVAPYFTEDLIESFFNFLLKEEALGDRHGEVRKTMLGAASKVIDIHGTKKLPELIAMFEKQLSSPSSSQTADYIKEASVVLLGTVARHLDASDKRLPSVIDRLIEALKTPSEQVQIAVSDCLPPLVKLVRSSTGALVDKLLQELFHAPKYGERRGAAYGLAGVLRGTGISGIKEFDILPRLKAAMEDKKEYEPRQGAMFAMETLSAALGRNFEPYIIELLPSLLSSFGDPSPDVREATEDAAKVIMANLSGYGVKKILPTLLEALEEKQWRTKKGAIELLGTMAFCAPKQLSISLPTVIPQLTNVLTDSHAQVRAAANKSLKQFGEVISNPEIHAMVPVLLKALVDPIKTPQALNSLLKTSFAHYIDSPSLALLVPIIERGLRERSSDTKRRAVQIVGNLASLTDSQDFVPYLTALLPLVHVVLVDPVPEARATAAKALGTLIERLGEEQFPDMVPNLLRTLKADTSTVDRLGAAQGLSEVLAGLGMERLEALLPDIVSNAQSSRSNVREGFMSLLVFLPATFGVRFQPHLPKIIGPILSGLSDTEEKVREEALKAGRIIITNYSSKAIDLLLPELERGMFDQSWRIRVSSTQLVGELLFKISGISGKPDADEDIDEEVDNVAAEPSRKALGDALGRERRDRILSSLYIIRQDPVANVRTTAGNIWKALVHNTPRTVRELLPELIRQLIFLLVNQEEESAETAAKTVSELCRKFGERILGEIIPLLRTSSTSSDSRTREGVCLVLCEIMQSATDTQRETYDDDITAIVRSSLVDEAANVRGAAARAFDGLQEHLGKEAIDKTIPTLLEALRQPGESSGTALQALREVMTVRASTVFPILVPTLLASPITVFNAHALASLVTVAGNALTKHLQQILESLISAQETHPEDELANALTEAVDALISSIRSPDAMDQLLRKLADWVQSGSPRRRANACRVFGEFCSKNDLDDSTYRTDWVRYLISLHDDPEEEVHKAASQAFDAFVKSVPKDELDALVVQLRRTIESTGAPGRTVPGFSLPKGITPMVPVIIAGLTTGSNEQRENAAYAIGDLVTRTEETAFKPFVIQFTGPLIRVATQAATYPPGVKSAILSALTTLLEKIPASVKPFFPQLQRTFVKATSDPSSLAVRNRAVIALGVLMHLQTRVDPVVTELLAGAKGSDDEIAASHVKALAEVVRSSSEHLGEKAREACVELVSDAFKESHNDHYVQAIALLFEALSTYEELLKPIINAHLMPGTPPSPLASHIILTVLAEGAGDTSEQRKQTIFQRLDLMPSIAKKVQESIGADRPSITRPAREAREHLLALQAK